ncbi:MAG: PQQ-dependent sugar dehydrogenase [Pikeienuella sp.]
MRVIGIVCTLAAGAAWALGGTPPEAAERVQTSAGAVLVERMAGPFDHPWGVTFLPGGEILVTERSGAVIHLGSSGPRALEGVPSSVEDGQGGMLDVVAARDFAQTREIFLSYAAPAGGGATRTTLTAAKLSADGTRLDDLRVLFQQEPPVDSGRHFGSRIVEAPDGTLFVTIGDRGDPPLAQHADKTIGKVVRVTRDGAVPADNPFVDDPQTRDEIWSIGHRNAQGAALDGDGRLWTVEHGARGGDEINRPEAGKNYGWPRISYGTEYSGWSFPGSAAPGLEQPAFYWDPSIAPSGMTIYSGALWPEWAGDFFVGALKSRLISRLEFGPDGKLREVERLIANDYGRVRDVREGPDGALWFLTDASDGALYRIRPAE